MLRSLCKEYIFNINFVSVLGDELVAVFKFELLTLINQKTLKLHYFNDGKVLLINHVYKKHDIYLDSSVAEYLQSWKRLILLNTKPFFNKLFLVIFEDEKYWRMAYINLEGVMWGGGLGGKLITKEGLKKKNVY